MIHWSARFAGVSCMATLLALSACSSKDKARAEAEAGAQRAIDSARMALDSAAAPAPSSLAGSSWRLVRLQSSDDQVFAPLPGTTYTVTFGADSRVSVVADCNRGNGSWQAVPPSGLMFGPLATTRAMCQPGSMSDRFLRDFQYMRSYVIVDGGLHISLMADGGIYQFAPVEAAGPAEVAIDPSAGPVIYVCTDSAGGKSRLFATFTQGDPARAKLAWRAKTVVATQVRSASGARYEGPGVTFWSRGREAVVTWSGAELKCAARGD